MTGSRQPLRIAFIGARGVIGTYSGIETYYEEVGSRLAARGHHVVAHCRRHFTPDVPSYRGIRVRRLPSLGGSKHLETWSHSVLATLDVLPRRFDIVQYHAIGSAPLSFVPRLVGKKTVVSVRGLDWQRGKWGPGARAFLRFGEWASARLPSATCVVSAGLQRHYADTHGRMPYFIPNAVVPPVRRPIGDLADLKDLRGRPLPSPLESDRFVLFGGRLSPEKGVDTLLDAWTRIAERARVFGVPLVIAGGSSHTATFVDALERRAVGDVRFLGQVDRPTMDALYSHCRAFVLPSLMEGLSVALLEALSYGLCIVTTSIPENLEVVGDVALTVEPGDVDSIVAALETVLEADGVVASRRTAAAERAAAWPGWDEVAEMTESLYYRVLGLPGPEPDALLGAARPPLATG